MPKQALSFLSKKSWHTGKIRNQEAVWIEEQKKAAEDKKIKGQMNLTILFLNRFPYPYVYIKILWSFIF